MPRSQQAVSAPEAEPGRRGLWLGILAYRWASFAWMTVLAVASRSDFRNEELAWAAIGATGAWTAWLTVSRGWERLAARWFDLGLALALLLVSGLVMREGGVVRGYPFFATAYPVSAAMTWGAAGGLGPGLLSGVTLSVALAMSRPINGVQFPDLSAGQVAALGNGIVYYLSAGGAVGLVSRVLNRAATELQRANENAARERERAARLAERESLGRQIHDSVLQALAMVNKRGKELGAQTAVPGREVRSLAEMAGRQEQALRTLIQSEPEEPPSGRVSLRRVLEAATYGVTGVPVTITTVGMIWLPADDVDELSAAVHQALENVAEHAHASQASVFADEEDGQIVVSVRDDGAGFEYDEELLRREGKLGVIKSMKGRIEDLGGTMRIQTAPGAGTEVEFRVPAVKETRA